MKFCAAVVIFSTSNKRKEHKNVWIEFPTHWAEWDPDIVGDTHILSAHALSGANMCWGPCVLLSPAIPSALIVFRPNLQRKKLGL